MLFNEAIVPVAPCSPLPVSLCLPLHAFLCTAVTAAAEAGPDADPHVRMPEPHQAPVAARRHVSTERPNWTLEACARKMIAALPPV
eukprot:COSAG02_NODE_5764_length_4058_cov_1.871937_3_plen_86_part_00